jgi:Tfp pilus assembly protein PilF
MMDRIVKLKEFLAASPADSFLQHALALEYIKMGQQAQARQLFENILEKDPEYVGSYYHLGKLLEASGELESAILWYQKGMVVAKQLGEQHSYNELQAAYEDLVY